MLNGPLRLGDILEDEQVDLCIKIVLTPIKMIIPMQQFSTTTSCMAQAQVSVDLKSCITVQEYQVAGNELLITQLGSR